MRSDQASGFKARTRQATHERAVLWITIPYTTPQLTREALRYAGVCTDALDVHIHLIDVHTVPFPCPMECPPVSKEHSERRLLELAQQSRLPGRAHVVYSRDQFEGFLGALPPKSLVVIATKKRWWPTRETKLARFLTQAHHEVMLLVVR